MQVDDLLSPGFVSNAHKLRTEAWKAISYARTQADLTEHRSDCAGELAAFFKDCYEKAVAIKPKKEKTK
jgi:hypothetical protein